MIDISKLYCNGKTTADLLRYGKENSSAKLNQFKYKSASKRKPIVVWNTTKQCNLKCLHCYSNSNNKKDKFELTTKQGFNLIDQLADYQIPSLLFSGGEPLMRSDILTLIEYASNKGLRTVISTNGTLITQQTAIDLKNAGLIYAGISLDGMQKINDTFRGENGAFKKTLKAFKHCDAINLKTGLRMTLTRQNYQDLDEIFDFIIKEKIKRACFYHLVYSGRAAGQYENDLSHDESRDAIDRIINFTKSAHLNNQEINVLTVDNHADGVYLYLKAKKENHSNLENIFKMLKWNGGAANSTGVGIACIDHQGKVHADQFWRDYSFGNILERNFSEIWNDESDQLMSKLKNKSKFLKGRCKYCKYQDICCGGMRVRALRKYNDAWAPDPQCYLTDNEIDVEKSSLANEIPYAKH